MECTWASLKDPALGHVSTSKLHVHINIDLAIQLH